MPNEEIRIANIETVLRVSVGLFIENGIQNTTREMISRASGLSRRSTERYFPTMTDCVVQAAVLIGMETYKQFGAKRMLGTPGYQASDIFKIFLDELKQIVFDEPRILVCLSEFKTYLYRNSEDRVADYKKFADAMGCRRIFKKIFELGAEDGTVKKITRPEIDAGYLTDELTSYFTTAVLLYDTQTQVLRRRIEDYIADTWNNYCG
jgi:AcrR family transcriptional regulator